MNILNNCNLCPRECGADRTLSLGYCKAPQNPKLARATLHFWEEPCISGKNGSGTVFFSGCNLKCVYCQNHSVSQQAFGKEVTIERLGEIFLDLQRQGAHNINLVSPTANRATKANLSLKPTKFSQFHISGCSAVGSALALGARCRRFESCHSDHIRTKVMIPLVLQLSFFFYIRKPLCQKVF